MRADAQAGAPLAPRWVLDTFPAAEFIAERSVAPPAQKLE